MVPFKALRSSPLILPVLSLALLALAAPGCGGGSGGPSSGPRAVSVTADPTSVAYGGETTVRWSSVSDAELVSSDFGVGDGNVHGGSIADKPGTTTTYDLRVARPDGAESVGRATVTVAKLSAGVLVVGDASKAGPSQMLAFARTLTTGTVDLAAAIPEPSDAYKVLLVSPTVQATTSEGRVRAKAWLDAGKGVILCGRAPSVLATGVADNPDVGSIGSWFLGVDELHLPTLFGVDDAIRSSDVGTVLLSAAIRADPNDSSDVEGYVSGYGPQVDGVATDAMCAYPVPTGGRLVYSGSPVGYGNAPGGSFQQAFESAFRWAGR